MTGSSETIKVHPQGIISTLLRASCPILRQIHFLLLRLFIALKDNLDFLQSDGDPYIVPRNLLFKKVYVVYEYAVNAPIYWLQETW